MQENQSKINPYYILGCFGILAAAGAAYWYFTQAPKAQDDAIEDEQKRKNLEEALQKERDAKTPSTLTVGSKNYSAAKTSAEIFQTAPKSAGKRDLGDAVVIRACVAPRRLNEKLEFVEDAPSKIVAVKLGSIWGWSSADHNLITKGGVAAPNIIVKSDDAKIATFYEVKAIDVQPSDIGLIEKAKDKAKCALGADGYVSAEGLNSIKVDFNKLLPNDSWEI